MHVLLLSSAVQSASFCLPRLAAPLQHNQRTVLCFQAAAAACDTAAAAAMRGAKAAWPSTAAVPALSKATAAAVGLRRAAGVSLGLLRSSQHYAVPSNCAAFGLSSAAHRMLPY